MDRCSSIRCDWFETYFNNICEFTRPHNILKNLHHLYHLDKSKRTQAGIFVDLLENEYNVNIDAVIDYYGGIEQYLIPKIPEMVVIKKKSKKHN